MIWINSSGTLTHRIVRCGDARPDLLREVIGVLLAAVGSTLVAAVVFVLLGFVGVPFAYLSFRKTSAQERREGRPGGPSWLS